MKQKIFIEPGTRFGRLVVIGEYGRHHSTRAKVYLCRCDCGNTKEALSGNLRFGKTSSCGCWQVENTRKIHTTHGHSKIKSQAYTAWLNMKTRCYNASKENFPYWQGRGITVCERWLNSFENFLADMGYPPTKNHSIDRIDNDGNYEPGNCRWATAVEQRHNQRHFHTREVNKDETAGAPAYRH